MIRSDIAPKYYNRNILMFSPKDRIMPGTIKERVLELPRRASKDKGCFTFNILSKNLVFCLKKKDNRRRREIKNRKISKYVKASQVTSCLRWTSIGRRRSLITNRRKEPLRSKIKKI